MFRLVRFNLMNAQFNTVAVKSICGSPISIEVQGF